GIEAITAERFQKQVHILVGSSGHGGQGALQGQTVLDAAVQAAGPSRSRPQVLADERLQGSAIARLAEAGKIRAQDRWAVADSIRVQTSRRKGLQSQAEACPLTVQDRVLRVQPVEADPSRVAGSSKV